MDRLQSLGIAPEAACPWLDDRALAGDLVRIATPAGDQHLRLTSRCWIAPAPGEGEAVLQLTLDWPLR